MSGQVAMDTAEVLPPVWGTGGSADRHGGVFLAVHNLMPGLDERPQVWTAWGQSACQR